MECQCCRKKKAEVKDFRTNIYDITSSYRVCRGCFGLSDLQFFELLLKDNRLKELEI